MFFGYATDRRWSSFLRQLFYEHFGSTSGVNPFPENILFPDFLWFWRKQNFFAVQCHSHFLLFSDLLALFKDFIFLLLALDQIGVLESFDHFRVRIFSHSVQNNVVFNLLFPGEKVN